MLPLGFTTARKYKIPYKNSTSATVHRFEPFNRHAIRMSVPGLAPPVLRV